MYGMQRALFSNEAGQGSSAIAHSAAKTDEPIREGVVAGLEPFIDTIVVCTMSALVILVTGIWNRPGELIAEEVNFSQAPDSSSWVLSTTAKDVIDLQQGQRVYMIYEGELNPATGNNLNKIYGITLTTNQNSVIEWEPINIKQAPVINNRSIYLDYVGATLTAAAFDKVLPGLGKWLVTLASWLFAISTMISWSYYGEKGVVFLVGEKGVILYKVGFCALAVLATTGFIETDAELNMFANLGTGLCIIANLPIIWLFGHQAMKEYKIYITKLKRGEFNTNN
jgi:AGCS family alanine or glycine:cation symporter